MPRRLTWREIAEDLKDRIRAGEYPPNQHIPSYRGIAELYGVSMSTAAKVAAKLTDDGWIEENPGRGNLVREDHPA